MLRLHIFCLLLLTIFTSFNTIPAYYNKQPAIQLMKYGAFGELHLYRPVKEPSRVIVCISGDGGWNTGIEAIALKIKDDNTLLVGVDIRPYLKHINQSKSSCLYPAADFEQMSQFIQKELGYKTYTIPILLGYSSGATLEYGLLAQAPQGTFKGGIAFGFCPDLAVKRPLCAGSGKFTCYKRLDSKGYDIGPAANLSAPFICMQGTVDQVCDYTSTVAFLHRVPKAEIVSLTGVGHGYTVEKNWVPQFKQAYNHLLTITTERETSVEADMKINLPLKVTEASKVSGGNDMVVMISGDGGWTGFDQGIAAEFANQGIPVVGLNSLKYFWDKKTPQQTTEDVLTVIEKYSALWKKEKIFLVGYSFGADVMPFVYNRLPEGVRSSVRSVGLLSPSKDTDFEVHVTDLLNFGSADREFSVPGEIDKMKDIHPVCFFGQDEEGVPANELPKDKCKVIYLQGGHHYENSYGIIYNNLVK